MTCDGWDKAGCQLQAPGSPPSLSAPSLLERKWCRRLYIADTLKPWASTLNTKRYLLHLHAPPRAVTKLLDVLGMITGWLMSKRESDMDHLQLCCATCWRQVKPVKTDARLKECKDSLYSSLRLHFLYEDWLLADIVHKLEMCLGLQEVGLTVANISLSLVLLLFFKCWRPRGTFRRQFHFICPSVAKRKYSYILHTVIAGKGDEHNSEFMNFFLH